VERGSILKEKKEKSSRERAEAMKKSPLKPFLSPDVGERGGVGVDNRFIFSGIPHMKNLRLFADKHDK